MHFWVFSYNRGVFLQNCVESIEQCAPMCTLTVFDDNSNDPETQRILANIRKKHQVMTPEAATAESKHGGLYANMQQAFESMPDGELMCFLQDDTQLVRTVAEQDFADIRAYFNQFHDAAFVQPAFLRGSNKAAESHLTRYDPSCRMYFVDRFERSAGAYYSDIHVADVQRLRSKDWKFQPRESGNELQAKASFRQIAYLRVPFAAWLPNVPAFRGKIQTWAMRKAQTLSNSGFYPIKIMTDSEAERCRRRENSVIPYAEDFLSVKGEAVSRPWTYYPLQGRRWLKRLNQLEVLIKHIGR